MKYERIITTRLLAQLRSIDFMLGRICESSVDAGILRAARTELESVRNLLDQELRARIVRRRRKR
jgi:hypothetical protein